MNKKFIAAIQIFLFSALMLIGCKQKPANVNRENDIAFDTITVNETYYLLNDTANPHCTLDISFVYPSDFKDKEVLQKAKMQFIHAFFGDDDALLQTPEEAMKKYARKYLSDYKDIEKDFAAEKEKENADDKELLKSWYTYYEKSFNKILYNKYGLLSYAVSIEYYTGGAHGGHGYNNFVFDLATGARLNEADVFTDNYQDELSKIIVETLAANNNVNAPSELEAMGFFNVEEIYPNNNFYVDDNGVTYTFNEYEIAAYAVGKVEVRLPYDKISRLIRSDSPVAQLIATAK